MNKGDLVDVVAGAAGFSKSATAHIIEETVAAIISAVSAGEAVRLSGFGTFEVQNRAPRTARNPRTGTQLVVPGTRVPRFRASPIFKEAVVDRGEDAHISVRNGSENS